MAAGAYVERCELLAGSDPARGGRRRSRTARWTWSGWRPPAIRHPGRPSSCGSCRSRSTRSSSRAGGTGPDRQRFSAPGRLARVGLAARLVDAGLVMSLLLARSGPGRHGGRGVVRYDAIRAEDPRVVYHGRVIREGRWVVLHYMFLYAMNDWRSTFEGANDHEADWEQCFVVLRGARRRRAATGVVLRRGARREGRRPSPPLGRPTARDPIDGHPVVYPGRRVARDLPRARRVHHAAAVPGRAQHPGPAGPRAADLARHPRPARSRRPRREGAAGAQRPLRRLRPRRRDRHRARAATSAGRRIIIGDADGWVDRYHGLWGLDTGDRFAGERAPAGPKYTRIGTVRQSWHDPLGFAGLDKVAPPSQAVPALEARVAQLAAQRETVLQRGGRAGSQPADAGCRSRCRPRDARRRHLPGRPGARTARWRGAPGGAAQRVGPARHRDRRRRAPAGVAPCRPPGRPAVPPPTRLRAGASGRDPTPSPGRGLGRPERRDPDHRARGHRLVPDPATCPRDRRAPGHVSRDRGLLPARRPRCSCSRISMALALISARHPGRDVPARARPRSACSGSGSCSSPTTSGSCAAGRPSGLVRAAADVL